jgi:hypothetical protein
LRPIPPRRVVEVIDEVGFDFVDHELVEPVPSLFVV